MFYIKIKYKIIFFPSEPVWNPFISLNNTIIIESINETLNHIMSFSKWKFSVSKTKPEEGDDSDEGSFRLYLTPDTGSVND